MATVNATQTAHPLAKSRQLFLRETARFERCRAEYQRRGEVDEALQMELVLSHTGEAVRRLELLIRATGGRVRP